MTIRDELEFLSDEEVVDIYYQAKDHLMYFEAAERDYKHDSVGRREAWVNFQEVAEEVRDRGLNPDRGGI